MKNTPFTDAQAGFVLDSTIFRPQGFELNPGGPYVCAEFARDLEEQNAELRRLLGKSLYYVQKYAQLCRQDREDFAADKADEVAADIEEKI